MTSLADRERDALALLEANPAPVLVNDVETQRVLWVNEAAVRFYGHTRAEFLELCIKDYRVESEPGEIEALIPIAGTPEFDSMPRVHRTASGELRIVKVNASRLSFDGRPAMIVAVTDLTELHRMQAEVERTRNFLREIVDQIPTAVFVKDVADAGRYVIYNKASEALFGRSSVDALGATASDVFGPEDAGRFAVQDAVALGLNEVATIQDESVVRPDGKIRHVRTRKVALADGGRPRFIIGVCEDVTDRRANEARIAHMAHHDHLTDLPNRFLFRDRLTSALARLEDCRDSVAVLCIDLDGFKAINDRWGHAMGDSLLRVVADRLRGALRGSDTAARFGGDEFAILQVPVAGMDEAARFAERVVAALGAPYRVQDRDLVVSASVGVALARSKDVDPAELLERADVALYRAKREGRNAFRVASEAIAGASTPQLTVLGALMRAIDGDNFDAPVAMEA